MFVRLFGAKTKFEEQLPLRACAGVHNFNDQIQYIWPF